MRSLTDLIEELYSDSAETLLHGLNKLKAPSTHVEAEDWDWYKRSVLYLAYPNSFLSGEKVDFYTLANQVPRIAELGCTVLHILPFLDSPMIDAGFDIRNYYEVRDELGGDEGLEQLLDICFKYSMRVFMDLVLNHTSTEHGWFRNAVAGDEFYRNFYIHEVNKPELIGKYTDSFGVWATYSIEGKEVSMRILFPEQAGELPHFEQGRDGYWYYHTFYPHQIDLNWHNPEVF